MDDEKRRRTRSPLRSFALGSLVGAAGAVATLADSLCEPRERFRALTLSLNGEPPLTTLRTRPSRM